MEGTYRMGNRTFRVRTQHGLFHELAAPFATEGAAEVTLTVPATLPACMRALCPVAMSHFTRVCDYPADYAGPMGPCGEVFYLLDAVAQQLQRAGCVMLHGCLLAYRGRGLLLSADSGVGKTTHARYWQQLLGEAVTLVNGDMPIVELRDEAVIAHGSPWDGKEGLGQGGEVALQAVVFLERGAHAISLLAPDEARERLVAQAIYHRGEEAELQRLTDSLARRVSAYVLHCTDRLEAAQFAFENLILRKR